MDSRSPLTALIVANAAAEARKVLENSTFSEFYIGRTNDPIGRKSDHDADRLCVVYETKYPALAQHVEDMLINKFYEHPQCQNDAKNGGGGVGEGMQYVYVATWR